MRLTKIPRITDARTIRRVAVLADVEPRTVSAYLASLPVRPNNAARIAAALASLGMADPRRVVA